MKSMTRLAVTLAFAAVASGQMPPGIQMGGMGGGGDDEPSLMPNAEELTEETFEERRIESELVRT